MLDVNDRNRLRNLYSECICGGQINKLERACNKCRISHVKLIKIKDRIYHGDIRLTHEMIKNWQWYKIVPKDIDMEILPVEMFEWI